MQGKVLFAVTSHGELGNTGKPTGYYLSEVTHPWSEISKNFDIDVVSPKGGKPPVDGMDLNDPINKKYWEDRAWQEKMSNTLTPDKVDPQKYMAVFFAGGHGAMWDFPNNAGLQAIIRAIYENGGLVGAVCHGPAALVNATLSNGKKLVREKKLDCFTNAEEKANGTAEVVPFMLQTALEEDGCVFAGAPLWADHVVVDERLVTGQNPMSALSLGKTMLNMLLMDH